MSLQRHERFFYHFIFLANYQHYTNKTNIKNLFKIILKIYMQIQIITLGIL